MPLDWAFSGCSSRMLRSVQLRFYVDSHRKSGDTARTKCHGPVLKGDAHHLLPCQQTNVHLCLLRSDRVKHSITTPKQPFYRETALQRLGHPSLILRTSDGRNLDALIYLHVHCQKFPIAISRNERHVFRPELVLTRLLHGFYQHPTNLLSSAK